MAAPQSTSFRAVVGRLTWMFFGPMLLVIVAFGIARKEQGFLSFADLAYFAVLGAMLAGRWVEFRCGDPQTADGEPATPEHLRRHTLAVSVIGLPVWGVATVFRIL